MKILIKTLTDLHIGSGKTDGIIDNDIILNESNQPFIPASTFKGVLKESCLEIAELIGLKLCDGEHNQNEGKKLCGISFEKPYGDFPCLLCLLFGSYNNEGALRITDGLLNAKSSTAKFTVTGHNKIDSRTGAASENALFIMKHVASGAEFELEMTYNDIPSELKELAENLLTLGLLNLHRIGGRRRKGKGDIALEFKGKSNYKTSEVKAIICNLKKYPVISITSNKVSKQNISLTPENYESHILVELTFKTKNSMTVNDNQISGNHYETLDYIPASNVSGLFFSKFFQQMNDSSLFQGLFANNLISFSNLFYSDDNGQALPWPKSLLTCDKSRGTKGHSTFLGFNKEKSVCEYCEAAMSSKGKSYCNFKQDGDVLNLNIVGAPSKRIRLRNNIDRSTQTTKDSGIYTYQEISENQIFKGILRFKSKEIFNLWQKVIFNGSKETQVSFGRGRSRGLGLGILSYKIVNINETYFNDEIKNRIEKSKGIIPLMFLTEAILVDEYLQFTKTISRDYFSKYNENLNFEFDSDNSFITYKLRYGFNSKKGLPAFPDIAIEPGSVIVLKFPDFEQNKNKVIEFLKQIETNGVGERQSEGFGQIITAPFLTNTVIKILDKRHDKDMSKYKKTLNIYDPDEIELIKTLDDFIKKNSWGIRSIPSSSSLKAMCKYKNVSDEILKTSQKSTQKGKWETIITDPTNNGQKSFIDFMNDHIINKYKENTKIAKSILIFSKLLNKSRKKVN
ncbi:MAG: RAMP superfamily CRISPR-associated protein [Candidatus Wallbacteria bacterium]